MPGSPSNRCAGCGWADPQGSFRCPGARRSGVKRCDGPCAALRSGAGLGHTVWGTPRLPTSALCEALPHEGCALLLCPPGKGLLTGLFAPCPHQGGLRPRGTRYGLGGVGWVGETQVGFFMKPSVLLPLGRCSGWFPMPQGPNEWSCEPRRSQCCALVTLKPGCSCGGSRAFSESPRNMFFGISFGISFSWVDGPFGDVS